MLGVNTFGITTGRGSGNGIGGSPFLMSSIGPIGGGDSVEPKGKYKSSGYGDIPKPKAVKEGLNEVEIEKAEMPASEIAKSTDPDFQKLVDYFEENPIKAKKVKDKLKTLEEITENQYGVNKSSDGSYFTQDGVYSTYYFKKNDKYYKKQSLPGGYGFGKHKTDEISKEDFQKIQKEYWKDQLMKIGLGAAAVGFVGALMAGPLGANDPGNILQAALIAAGFGGAAASIFE